MVGATGINIYYQNVRGLNSKTIDFYNAVAIMDFDVIAVTETWLDSHTSSGELFDDAYDVFRSDRNFLHLGLSRGGGVLLAVRSDLKPSSVALGNVFESLPSVDIVAANIYLHGKRFVFVCIYVPPNFAVPQYGFFLRPCVHWNLCMMRVYLLLETLILQLTQSNAAYLTLMVQYFLYGIS